MGNDTCTHRAVFGEKHLKPDGKTRYFLDIDRPTARSSSPSNDKHFYNKSSLGHTKQYINNNKGSTDSNLDSMEYFSSSTDDTNINSTMMPSTLSIASAANKSNISTRSLRATEIKQRCTVVIPFFNEEAHELQRTLISIHEQEQECLRNTQDELKTKVDFYYVAIMDGYYKASHTAINYVSDLFGDEWQEIMGEGDEDDSTTILQKKNWDDTLGQVEVAPGKFLKLTLIIKKQNRKKTNSHEWFFNAFVPQYEGEFAFTTDCGTLYAP
eukprot:Awhi_evm2s4546